MTINMASGSYLYALKEVTVNCGHKVEMEIWEPLQLSSKIRGKGPGLTPQSGKIFKKSLLSMDKHAL
jgi:hypothetical protein